MLIDTHSHIYSDEFSGEVDDVLKRAIDAKVEKILLPNIDSSSIKKMLDLADRFKDNCFPMIGIHPTSINEDYDEELELITYWLKKRKFYGIGEIGIDLYWDNTFKEEQKAAFKEQIRLSKEYGLPLSIHIRDSFTEVMACLNEEKYVGLKGVFHCFTGTVEQAKEVIDMGFKIGVGGIVTFKNAGIDKMVAQLNPEDIVLETDAPYLAPVPFRGKQNESSYLVHILSKVATLFDATEDDIAAITSQNAMQLFDV